MVFGQHFAEVKAPKETLAQNLVREDEVAGRTGQESAWGLRSSGGNEDGRWKVAQGISEAERLPCHTEGGEMG